MDKINFENGTKVKNASVTINNVDYQVTPEVWNGKTPISAENLNKMQTNAENAINAVDKKTSDNSKNITSLNADLKSENEYLNSVIEQAFTPVEKEGTSINYDNTINARFKDLKLGGDTTQVQYIGKNLLDSSKIVTGTKNGITLSYDKDTQIITINGTCTQDNTLFNTSLNLKATNNKTKLIVYLVSGSYSGTYGAVRIFDKNYGNNIICNFNGFTSNANKIVTTAKTDFTMETIDIRADKDTTFNNFKIKLMLTDSDNTDYEPYQGSTYPLSLGDMELCKIGDYQDYIYKKDNKWWKHKEIDKKELNINNWALDDSVNGIYQYSNKTNVQVILSSETPTVLTLSVYYKGVPYQSKNSQSWNIDNSITTSRSQGSSVRIMTSRQTTLDDFKNWIKNKDLGIRAVLSTPTEEQITNTTLIAQLNNLSKATTYAGETNITATSNGLTIIPKITALTK